MAAADFIITGYVSLGSRLEPHDRAARPARSVRVRGRPDRPHAAQPAALLRLPPAPGCGGRHHLDLQPHRDLLRRRTRGARPHGRAGWPRAAASRRRCCARMPTRCTTTRPRAMPSASLRARFDGAGRGADPRPDEGCRARGRNGRRARQHAEPAVPALVRRRQGSAHRHRDRRAFDQHGRSRRAAGRAAVRRPEADARAVRRRRRDDRPGGDAFRGQGAEVHRHRQPHAGARREAGLALRRRGDAAGRPARAAGRIRHRRQLHREHPAAHRPGRGRARAEGAQAPADVHGRPGRAARHRARGQGARRHLPLHRGRPGAGRAAGPGQPPGRGGAGRGDHRRRRAAASCTGSTSAAPCR